MTLDKGEEFIGSAGTSGDEINIISADFGHVYCGNCKKKKHCIAGFKKGEAPEMVKDRCNNPQCECKCRRFYIAANGRLKKYGEIDDTDPLEGFRSENKRTEVDDLIDLANAQVRSNTPKVEII